MPGMFRTTALMFLGAVAFGGACARRSATDAPAACTRDAKVCPDGTSVGRTGPNCEFAACPGGGADPCAGVELPACPTACPADAMDRCGQPCETEGERCGNNVGDGMGCEAGTWRCVVHAPLGPGCNLACR